MICKRCGSVLKEGAKFCTNCGYKIEFVNININEQKVDEFELEKQRLAQEELEKKLKEEKEKQAELEKENEKKRKESYRKFVAGLLTFCIILISLGALVFSGYSLYNEFTNNGIIKDGEDIMLKIDGVYQKNIRITYEGKNYYLGSDGRSQLYKLSVIGDKIKAQDESGNYMTDVTLRIDGYYYHFNELGEAIKDLDFDESYFDKNGRMLINDWHGDYYYGDDGKMKKNEWVGKYYVGTTGRYIRSSWTPDDYYVNEKGEKVINNKISYNGKYYYIGNDGKKILDSWIDLGGNKYRTDNSGSLFTNRKFTENGKTYYFKSDGSMLRNSIVDGHYADDNGVLAINRAVGFNFFDENGDMVVDKWIGTAYYDKFGTQVLNGWAQDFYLVNGAIQKSTWVDNKMYYVGADGIYLKDTYVNGYKLGHDGKWTGEVDYGLEIEIGNSRHHRYTGNRSSIRRKYFSEDDDDSYSYDSEDMEQDVNVITVLSITSSTGALNQSQLVNMKNAINQCLSSVFETYRNDIRFNSSIRLIDCHDIIFSSQQGSTLRFFCSSQRELFSDTTNDVSFYIVYDVNTNIATKN